MAELVRFLATHLSAMSDDLWLKHVGLNGPKLRKGKGAEDIRKELAYFRSNRRRMNYAAAAEAGFAIGSGAVETAAERTMNT